MEQQDDRSGRARDRAAARWAYPEAVARYGPVYTQFAEAVGRDQLIEQPGLFARSLVGCWPNMDLFVNDFIIESGLEELLQAVPAAAQEFVRVDRRRVAAALRRDLLIIEMTGAVWAFDAQPVVKTTVDKSPR